MFLSRVGRLVPFGSLLLAAQLSAQAPDPPAVVRPITVLLLGTFHFNDPGLDSYKPQFPWDAHSPRHQVEINGVLDRLARYAPTRIALEWPSGRQAGLDSAYAAFLAGAPANGNERQQLGFRLARRLGHDRVYAIDAPARSYFPDMTQAEYDEHEARLIAAADPAALERQLALEAAYDADSRVGDSLKTVTSLIDLLLDANDPAALLRSHGQYFTGGFHLAQGDDYLGPDMRTRWFNRNLRILQNIWSISMPGDRVLVIIGAGHVPILRHAMQASPEFAVVEVAEVLGERRQ